MSKSYLKVAANSLFAAGQWQSLNEPSHEISSRWKTLKDCCRRMLLAAAAVLATAASLVQAQAPGIYYGVSDLAVSRGSYVYQPLYNWGGAVPAQSLGAVSTFVNSANAGYYPAAVTRDASGNYYITEYLGHRIRKVSASGIGSVFAGNGSATYGEGTGTGAKFNTPAGITTDGSNLYVCDMNNGRVRKITSGGTTSTILSGLSQPNGIAYDAASRSLYVSEFGAHRIRRIILSASATYQSNSIIAGTGGVSSASDTYGTSAGFYNPAGLAWDASGNNLYVADQNNQRIQRIQVANSYYVSTVAGAAGVKSFQDGWRTGAYFSSPTGVAVDAGGNIYVSDKDNNRIRKILVDGTVLTLAGSSNGGTTDAADGLQATFGYSSIYHLFNDGNGSLLVADMYSSTIRRIHYSGYRITPAPGNGLAIDNYGTIYGTAGSASAPVTYTVTGSNDWGQSTTYFSVSVYNPAPSLSGFYDVARTYGDGPFTLAQPATSSTGGFSYGSSNNGVASISGNTVYINGAGTTTITAYQAADANYSAGSLSMTLTVYKANPSLWNFPSVSTTYGAAPFGLGQPSSNSTGGFSYGSSNSGVASISGSTVYVNGAGSATITAYQAADANFNAGSIAMTLSVAQATPSISALSVPAKTFGDAAFNLANPSSNSGGGFTYSSSNTAVATVSGNTVAITGAGSTTITATQAATANYNSGSVAATLTVGKANPTIGALSVPTKTFGDAAFNLTNPVSNSTGNFTYASSNTSVATISGNTVTIVGAGTATITATQATDANYTSGSVSATLTVGKANPAIGALTVPAKTFGDAAFNLTNPSSNSGGGFTYSSSNTAVATVSGNTVTIIGAGSATITATQAADANYNTGSVSATLTAGRANPVYGAWSIPAQTFGNTPFTVAAPASTSGGTLSYTSDNTAVATVSGNTITIVGAGTANITASQLATTNHNAGSISTMLVVNKANPTISTLVVPTKSYGDAPFALATPTSNSPGAITLSSSNTSVATISGNTVTIAGAGAATITATQAATLNFNGGSVTAAFNVAKSNPSLSGFPNINKHLWESPITLTTPTSNSTGNVTYSSSNTAVATVSGSTVTFHSAGTVTITATQAADANYNSGTLTATLTVTNPAPTIGLLSVPAKTYGDAPFTLTDPTSNSTGAFTYASSNTSVATVSGNIITIVGAGTATITATQAGTSNYSSGSVSATLTVGKANPTISVWTVPAKTYGDAAFTLTAPASNSTGSFTYTSSSTGVATTSGNTVIIIGAGTTTLTATQAGDANYNSGSVSATFTVAKADPGIGALAIAAKTYGDAAFVLTQPATSSTGTFTYTSSNANVATISGNTVTIVGAGATTITAAQATDANYTSGSVHATLSVGKAAPVMGVLSVGAKTYEDAPFTLTAPASNSTGGFTYASSNTSVATVSGNTVSIVGAGSATITATQAADDNFVSGSVSAALTVAKANPSVGALVVPAKTFGDAAFGLTDPASNSTGTFSYTSSNTNVAAISGNAVTITGAGTATITATQSATTNYNSAAVSATLAVGKATPVIGAFTVVAKTFGDAPFSLSAPASNSTGAFTYASSNTSVATISGNTVTIVGAGTATITATQATDANYVSGVVSAALVVAKATPVLGVLTVPATTYNDAAFSLADPSSNSTGGFTYASSNTNVATISGQTVTIVGAGTATIMATQAGDANYVSGSVSATLSVAKDTPAIGVLNVPAKTYEDAPFALTDPASNSTGAFTYKSSNTSVAIVSGNTVTIVGAGVATITATQAGDDNYTGGAVTATLNVGKATPAITGFVVPAKTYEEAAFALTAPASTSTGGFTYTSSNTNVATINGNTVTIVGAGTAVITAMQAADANYVGGSVTATLNVAKATPTITGFADVHKMYEDAPFSLVTPSSTSTGAFTYTSSNTSVATINGNTVTITGAGSAIITAIQAADANYNSGAVTATVTVGKAMPAITGFANVSKTYEDAPFALTDPASTSTGAFTYASSNTNVATISGNRVTIVGAGTAVITATQAADANYNSDAVSATISVAKAAPAITGFANMYKVYEDAPFALTAPASTSTGGFTYTSSNNSVATVNGNTVTITGAGTATIIATQAADNNYVGGSVTAVLEVAKAAPAIGTLALPAKTYEDAPFALTVPASNSTGAFTYTSSNTGVATVSGNTITITGAGFAIITASQAADANYTSGSVTATLEVAKAIPAIGALTVPAKTYGDAAFTVVDPASTSTGGFSYVSSDNNVATVNGQTITITGAGTATITATQATDANYNSGAVSAQLVVAKANPVIGVLSVPARTYEDAPFALTAPVSNSTGAFTYTSANTSVATVSGNTVTIVGAGAALITATQAADDNFNSGFVTATLVVAKAAPAISVLPLPAATYEDAPFSLVAPSSTSTGGFTYASSNTNVATISGNTVTIVGAGTATITATQAADANYNSGSVQAQLAVAKATPVIGVLDVPAKTYGNAPFGIAAPASNSTGVFSFSSSNTSVATVNGNTITITGAGTAIITATQAADANYLSGSVSATLSVAKAMPLLSALALPAVTYGDAPFVLQAPASNSTGAIAYTSSNPSVATIDGNKVTITGAGNALISAAQAADANYLAGTTSAVLVVSKAIPAMGDLTVPAKTFGEAPFNLSAPSSNSTGAFTYTSSNNGVATISGNTLTITGAGTAVITATQATDNNYQGGSVTATLVVAKAAPVINALQLPAKTYGDAPFSLATPASTSTGVFGYTSSDPAVATINGNLVTITGSGTAIITATQAADANHIRGSVSATLQVGAAQPLVSGFGDVIKTYGDAAFALAYPASNSAGAFTFASSNNTVATISGHTVTIVGAGAATITATQAAAGSFASTTVQALLTVTKAAPALTGFANLEHTYGDAPFILAAPQSNSTGAFTYTSSNTAVARVNGNKVTIVGAGTAYLVATQAADANYNRGSVQATLTVAKQKPAITWVDSITKIYGGDAFGLPAPASSSNGAYSYRSSNSRVALVSGNQVTIVGAGTAIITATQAATANYESDSVSAVLTVARALPQVSGFGALTRTYGDQPFLLADPVSNSEGAFRFESADTSVATVSGNTITITGAGTTTLRAIQEATAHYEAQTVAVLLTVNKAATVLGSFADMVKTYGDADFVLAAPLTNNEAAMVYSSSDTTVAQISGNKVTLVGAGTATITVAQPEGANHLAARISAQLTVKQAAPVLGAFAPLNKVYGDAPFVLQAPASNSTGAFTYTSSNPAVATVSGNTITITGAGVASITAFQAADANFTMASAPTQLEVARANPVIDTLAAIRKTYGDVSFALRAPASSSTGAFTYTTSNPAVARITGNMVTITGAGMATITATQVADNNYVGGTVAGSLIVDKAMPRISGFGNITKTDGDQPFALATPVSNSTGTFTYTSSNNLVASVSGNTVTVIDPGTAVITATQAGDDNYLPGSISMTLTVQVAPPPGLQVTAIRKTFNDVPFWLDVPASPNPAAFKFTSTDTSVATLSGRLVTLVGAGKAKIIATNTRDARFKGGVVIAEIVVAKDTAVLNGFHPLKKTYGDTAFVVAPPNSNVPGVSTFRSSNPSVAEVQGNVVVIKSAGMVTLTADFHADDYFGSAETTLQVESKELQVVALDKKKCQAAAVPKLEYEISGFVPGEDVGSLKVLPQITTKVTRNSPAGTYPITLSGGEAENYTFRYKEGTLTVAVPPAHPKHKHEVVAQRGQPVQLHADVAGISFHWTEYHSWTTVGTAQTITVKPQRSAEYLLHATDSIGCVLADTVKVRVIGEGQVFVPTLFSPNGDGINETLCYSGTPLKQLRFFRVYNQWGQLVFQTNQTGVCWDGRSQGRPLAEGTYVWVLAGVSAEGRPVNTSGATTLVR